jgi:hypothetical protein
LSLKLLGVDINMMQEELEKTKFIYSQKGKVPLIKKKGVKTE